MSKTPNPPSVPGFVSKWGRSPRQDRRVVINGKFVELGPVVKPTPPVEEQESALEIVHEEIPNDNTQANTEVVPTVEPSESEKLQAELEPLDAVAEHVKGSFVLAKIAENIVQGASRNIVETDDVDSSIRFLETPPIPEEAFKFIYDASKRVDVLSGGGEDPASQDVLPGATGRVGQVEDIDDESTSTK